MLFNSYIFIFLFLPLCLGGFYFFAHRGQSVPARLWLTGFSLWFYGYFNPSYLLIMACSILFNFAVYRGMAYAEEKSPAWRRTVMILGVAGNLAVLFYFKYYDFFVENVNAVFGTSFALKGILLPLGISFFTFQQIGFVVDAYRGEVKKCSFLDYMLFVSFFPQLIAGPIVSQAEMLPQFAQIGKKKADMEKISAGIYLFTLGLVKKVLVADTFGMAVDWGYSNIPALSSVDSLLLIPFYSIQLYFDFSGYCDMARGLAWMFGMEIPVNFNSPYKSVNIIEFWRRWHITLSRFFRQYVYIPLGGNRRGRPRMYTNLILIFLLSGIWHGAGWTFVTWGAAQGVLYIITRAWQLYRKDHPKQVPPGTREDQGWLHRLSMAAGTLFTFCYYSAACVFFRSENMTQAFSVFCRLFTGGVALPSASLVEGFNLDEFWYILKLLHLDRLPYSEFYLPAAITIGTLLVVFFAPNADECAERFRPRPRNALLTAFLFLWCVLSLAGVSSFLYFNF
ncbi:MAG TPA: MBOAT family protein [Candidatus Eisenbergiella merdipullorum]|uniref:MBOAT family protein n=1 Tax=Candidatus Eisenbergiella merdipullorum TaxID=2838553 RepID=A0A9D2I874_9FIRM|nr:MBOAT family protein [Candidatus Eisenbergiella merdipullorum]